MCLIGVRSDTVTVAAYHLTLHELVLEYLPPVTVQCGGTVLFCFIIYMI